ncbi:MAG: hypothetical protein ACPK7O_07945 [Methanobacterium sp.]
MDRKDLLITGILISFVILVMGLMIIPSIVTYSMGQCFANYNYPEEDNNFNNSTPKSTAISIAKLNYKFSAFCSKGTASLTSDGEYWVVKLDNADVITVDAETWISKEGNLNQPNTWKSLDELKVIYIATIQARNEIVGKPEKITMDGKEIWKVPVYKENFNPENYHGELIGEVYVDLLTGKSKKEYNGFFNKIYGLIEDVNGIDGWLSLKQLDYKIGRSGQFKDALRGLYPE